MLFRRYAMCVAWFPFELHSSDQKTPMIDAILYVLDFQALVEHLRVPLICLNGTIMAPLPAAGHQGLGSLDASSDLPG